MKDSAALILEIVGLTYFEVQNNQNLFQWSDEDTTGCQPLPEEARRVIFFHRPSPEESIECQVQPYRSGQRIYVFQTGSACELLSWLVMDCLSGKVVLYQHFFSQHYQGLALEPNQPYEILVMGLT